MIDWDKANRELSPVKNFEELSQCLRRSLAYPFVCENFNFTLRQLTDFVNLELGGDPRGRYAEYASMLSRTLIRLQDAGLRDVQDLINQAGTREQLERLVDWTRTSGLDILRVLKYLLYWFLPKEKPLIGLVPDDPEFREALSTLRKQGVRTNLELLQKGITIAGREEHAYSSGLAERMISDLVNRADLSRMPWTSKATISNIVESGYGSVSRLAAANLETLTADYLSYGSSIGKNLKLGNEIENSHRIAKLIPVLVQDE